MKKRNILIPAHTVAEWGGLQEYAVGAARALVNAGHRVTMVGAGELFQTESESTGAEFIEVNWADLENSVNLVLRSQNSDLIYSHSPLGRSLGLKLNQHLKIEHIVGVHGAYHDYMPSWVTQVDALLAVSPSLVHFVQRFGRAEPWKVGLAPNGISDAEFENPIKTLEQRVSGEKATIVLASRLAKDKFAQLECLEQVLPKLIEIFPDVSWKIEVLGDGKLREEYQNALTVICSHNPGVEFEMLGWVSPSEVSRRMGASVITIAAGRSAIRAIAAGTLCLGVGARGSVGVQTGQNLRAGMWSNFGDHGFFTFESSDLGVDLEKYCCPSVYEETVETARLVVEERHRQTRADEKLLAGLHC